MSKPITYDICLTPQLEPHLPQRFTMVRTDTPGHLPTFGPCAKALNQIAFDDGAWMVSHNYDLNADDCREHLLYRLFF